MGEKVGFGWLITFRLLDDLAPRERTRFFQQFYGYKDHSQYGRYQYFREGLLGEIPHVRVVRAGIIVKGIHKRRVLDFLKGKAMVEVRRVALTVQDRGILTGKEGQRRKSLSSACPTRGREK